MPVQLPTAAFNALVASEGEPLPLGPEFEMLVDPAPCTVAVYFLGAHVNPTGSSGGKPALDDALPHMHNGLGVAITYDDRGREPTHYSFDLRSTDAQESALLPNSNALEDAEASGALVWHNAASVRANRGERSWKGPLKANPYWSEARMVFRGIKSFVCVYI
jgi:hypothetical protein